MKRYTFGVLLLKNSGFTHKTRKYIYKITKKPLEKIEVSEAPGAGEEDSKK